MDKMTVTAFKNLLHSETTKPEIPISGVDYLVKIDGKWEVYIFIVDNLDRYWRLRDSNLRTEYSPADNWIKNEGIF